MRIVGARALSACLLAWALVAPRPVAAIPRPELHFTDSRELPALGLGLRVMRGAREKPLPTAHTYPYRITTADGAFDAELFDPQELWVADQHAAEWVDDRNNRLIIATIRHPPMPPTPQPHVSRENYESLRPPATAPAHWNDTSLAAWMDAFVGSQGAIARALSPPFARFTDLEEFAFPSGPTNVVAYALRLNPAALGQSRVPTDWIAAIVHLAPGLDRAQTRRAMQSRFLYYVTAAANAGDRSPAPSARFQLGAAPTPESRSRAIRASKQRIAASIANLSGWWYAETENFILLSNVSAAERTTIRRLQAEIEVLRTTFQRLIPPRVPVAAVSVVRMPATEDAYLDYVGPEYAWTGGLWMPARKELVLRPLSGQGARERHDQMLRAAYHESFHQYLYYAFDRVDAAPWFNEGHAVMVESPVFRDRGVQLREHPDITPYLLATLEAGPVAIPEILRLDLAGFYAADNEVRAGHYALAWGLVYFLRMGIAPAPSSPYANILNRYTDALWRTRDGEKATTAAFLDVDLDQLARDFRAFWLSSKRRAAAERAWRSATENGD